MRKKTTVGDKKNVFTEKTKLSEYTIEEEAQTQFKQVRFNKNEPGNLEE